MMALKRQIAKFIFTGLISTLISYCLYIYIYKKFDAIILGSSIGYVVGLINSYLLGKIWVFKSRTRHNLRSSLSFLLVYGIGGFGQAVIIYLLNKLNFAMNISWIIGMSFSVVNNFLGSKYIVFKR